MHNRDLHITADLTGRPRRWVAFLASHLVVAGLAMAATNWIIREGFSRQVAEGIRNNCLVTASIVRAQFRRAGIPSRTLVVDYDVRGRPLRHVAVVSTLEDGSLAAFDEDGGSFPLGFVGWDPSEVAERLPADPLARVVRAAWAESLSFRELAWKPPAGPPTASRAAVGVSDRPVSLAARDVPPGPPDVLPP